MIRWYFLALGVLALDQLTKWIALDALEGRTSIEVLPFLHWTLACNTGAAFSMFQGFGLVFAVAAVGVSAFLIVEIWRLPGNEREREVQRPGGMDPRKVGVAGAEANPARSECEGASFGRGRAGLAALGSGWLEGASYGLVLAGALGNLADRLMHGCVVDFIHVHYGWFNFPVFNVADSAITIGAAGWIALVVGDAWRRRVSRRESP